MRVTRRNSGSGAQFNVAPTRAPWQQLLAAIFRGAAYLNSKPSISKTKHQDAMRAIRQPAVPTGKNLRQTAPGLYVDEAGAQYFYLTGMYPVIALCIGRNPLLNTPSFLVDVLGELRMELNGVYQIELMD